MKNNRREFLKKTAMLASAASVGGFAGSAVSAAGLRQINLTKKHQRSMIKDAGMQMSEAYFSGMDERRMAFMKQLDVLGAVSGINPTLRRVNGYRSVGQKSNHCKQSSMAAGRSSFECD